MTGAEQVMLFKAGDESLGIGISAVRRIVEAEYITPIPRAPLSVAGAILFEGLPLPVFQFAVPAKAQGSHKLILVVQHESNLLGLVIDNVIRVVEWDADKAKNITGSGNLEATPFKMLSPNELIPSGLGDSRGGKND